MAFSGSQNINQYAGINLYTPDFQLISTALTAKQQKLDTNRAKLQSYRDQLGLSLDVAKDADQKYIDDRLSQLTTMTNQYASMDLSNDGLTQSLMSNLGQVIDGNVKNAVTSTKILQSEQAEWSDKRKNKPDLYSEDNYKYAMQKANSWMNDNTVGTAYNGGGGFIEYVDVNGKLMKALPDLMKSFTEEQVQQVKNGQPIGSIIKTQSINKGKMSAAIESLLGAKERQQLEINAWSTYDGVPDAKLAAEYEGYISNKADLADTKVKTLQDMLSNSSGAQKEAYKKELEFWKSERDEIDNMSYDNVVAQGGKKAVYNTLYNTQFKNQFLEAFTFNDRIIDIDVDATAKANLDYAETVRHHQEREKSAAATASKKGKNGEEVSKWDSLLGLDIPVTVSPSKSTINYEQTKKNYAENATRHEVGSRDALRKSLVDKGFTSNDANELMADTKFRGYLAKGDFTKGFTDENGKVVKLPASVLQDYQEAYVTPPKVKKDAFRTVDKVIKDAQANLLRGVASGGSSLDDIPQSKWRFKKVGEQFELVADPKGDRYKILLQKRRKGGEKGGLTTDEQKELNLMSSLHLLNDPKLRPADRNLIRQKIIGENLREVKYNNNTAKFIKEVRTEDKDNMAGFTNKKGQFGDLFFSNFTEGDVSPGSWSLSNKKLGFGGNKTAEEKRVDYLINIIETETARKQLADKSYVWTAVDYVADVTGAAASEKELSRMKKEVAQLKQKIGIKGQGVDTIIKGQFDKVHREIDDYYASDAPMGVIHEISKENDKDYFRVAKINLGFEEDSKIKFEQLFDNQGVPTDKVRFYQDKAVYNTVKGETIKQVLRIAEATLTVAEANQKLGMNIDYKRGAKYDARVPSKARPIVIGNGLASSTAKSVKYSDSQANSYKSLYRETTESYGQETAQMVTTEFSKFVNGNYTIKYEADPETRQYVAYAYKGNDRAFDGVGVPVGDNFATSEINTILGDPNKAAETATNSFLAILDQYKDYYANKKYNTAY